MVPRILPAGRDPHRGPRGFGPRHAPRFRSRVDRTWKPHPCGRARSRRCLASPLPAYHFLVGPTQVTTDRAPSESAWAMGPVLGHPLGRGLGRHRHRDRTGHVSKAPCALEQLERARSCRGSGGRDSVGLGMDFWRVSVDVVNPLWEEGGASEPFGPAGVKRERSRREPFGHDDDLPDMPREVFHRVIQG